MVTLLTIAFTKQAYILFAASQRSHNSTTFRLLCTITASLGLGLPTVQTWYSCDQHPLTQPPYLTSPICEKAKGLV